jgi:hypothetical protein
MKRRVGGAITTTCLAALGVEMAACLGAGWLTSSHQVALEPVLSATEVVALRFPDELLMEDDVPSGTPADSVVAEKPAAEVAVSTAAEQMLMPSDRTATASLRNEEASLFFSPSVTYPSAVIVAAAPPPETATKTPPTVVPAPAPTRVASKSAPRHVNVRPGAVLSDGQIASIKQRLKLTPDQQQMWPAVEVALRNLTYDKKSGGDGEGSRVASIDTSSPEVQNLNSAAYPLVMSFSDDQKHEMNALAHVNGLDELVPKF